MASNTAAMSTKSFFQAIACAVDNKHDTGSDLSNLCPHTWQRGSVMHRIWRAVWTWLNCGSPRFPCFSRGSNSPSEVRSMTFSFG